MTLLEIYTKVVRYVYGDPTGSPPPLHEITVIQDEILNQHHRVQTDYNYWFAYVKTLLPLVDGTATYALPSNYKSLESDQEQLLDLKGRWEVIVSDLIFPDGISTTEDIEFRYWKFIETPTVWNDNYTDIITTTLQWVIIYAVTADIFLKRSATSEHDYYIMKRDKAEEHVQRTDYNKRQKHLKFR